MQSRPGPRPAVLPLASRHRAGALELMSLVSNRNNHYLELPPLCVVTLVYE